MAPGSTDPYIDGDMNRSVGNAGPNAVVQLTKPGGVVVNFTYDANGNQTSTDNRRVEPTSFNKPSKITRGTLDTEFWYGPDDRRYSQDASPRTKL